LGFVDSELEEALSGSFVVVVGCELVDRRADGMVDVAFVAAAAAASGLVAAFVGAPGVLAVVAAGELGTARIVAALDIAVAGSSWVAVDEMVAAIVAGAGFGSVVATVVGSWSGPVVAGELVAALVVETTVGLTVEMPRMAGDA
jgi:hypothetical protein